MLENFLKNLKAVIYFSVYIFSLALINDSIWWRIVSTVVERDDFWVAVPSTVATLEDK